MSGPTTAALARRPKWGNGVDGEKRLRCVPGTRIVTGTVPPIPPSAQDYEGPMFKLPPSARGSRSARGVRGRSPSVEPLEARSLLSTIVGLTTDNRLLRFDSENRSQIRATTP